MWILGNPFVSMTEKCYFCGKGFSKENKGYLIMVPADVRKNDPFIPATFVVHTDEWDSICKDVTDNAVLARKVVEMRTTNPVALQRLVKEIFN